LTLKLDLDTISAKSASLRPRSTAGFGASTSASSTKVPEYEAWEAVSTATKAVDSQKAPFKPRVPKRNCVVPQTMILAKTPVRGSFFPGVKSTVFGAARRMPRKSGPSTAGEHG